MNSRGQEFWHMQGIQPKRKFRWIATIGQGKKIFQYTIKKVVKPEWTTANKEHKMLGHTFNFPGPVTWNTVDVTFLDIASAPESDEEGNAALFLQEAIRAAGYEFPTSIGQATLGVTKERAVAALGGISVEQLNADGNALEKYTFYNPFIEKVNFGGDFDYDSDDLVDVTLTLRYDWAEILGHKGQGEPFIANGRMPNRAVTLGARTLNGKSVK